MNQHTELAPELDTYLDALVIDGLRITSGERTVTADDPAELRRKLGSMLYSAWHAGMSADNPSQRSPRRDPDFEQVLAGVVPHPTAETAATVRSATQQDDRGEYVIAEIGRVRVRVPADVVAEKDRRPGAEISIAVPAARPALSPGFLMVSGSAGGVDGPGEVLRMYLHVTDSDEVAPVWQATLSALEEHGARYRAKVLSRRTSFARRDAVVVYLPEPSWPHVATVARAVAGLPGIGDSTSSVAHRIGPGVALAWDPRDPRPGWQRMSFGQHRTAAIADGVLRHVAGEGPLRDTVAAALRDASADPTSPARNLSSPEFPVLASEFDLAGAVR
ncbi:T3SS effector HopA1 family protein [Micromonospora sp. DT228]|uniref:T3SS effector HopA1 family protein n=1 Tax=Micromonospora sp. DT228 TaxID=3393443 RepID=UPI003CF9E11E